MKIHKIHQGGSKTAKRKPTDNATEINPIILRGHTKTPPIQQ